MNRTVLQRPHKCHPFIKVGLIFIHDPFKRIRIRHRALDLLNSILNWLGVDPVPVFGGGIGVLGVQRFPLIFD